ncbi:N-acetyl-gamma-glutamyl-phosphate reductase [Snodgrassella alvi]|uniref:N-acetyl-gamma-glutamyl-phosphate reductase n=1 Tax=Snodgrassella alvi TaxID=1196083 RepID=A0A2N9Y191_9NEIS|nr:N-acetyl-gamma-glutamyl-phosphate reductase [Snodgrassella alvi]PIT59631.1 N-acetyl-gamma-glutamyl-phosphate reductase [Snodgrassella alvi]
MSIKIGIVGATGYTGVELLRLLAQHPAAEIIAVTSRSAAGTALSDYFPSLRGTYNHLIFQHPEQANLNQCDVVFFATPNGIAMQEAPPLLAQGIKIIDLSADYRIKDVALWQQWYPFTHTSPEWIAKAVYGLSELNRTAIAQAQLIANPGCYPTCVSLPLLPLLQQQCLADTQPLIADCKSGVSGAGRKADTGNLFAECSDNFKAYGISGHRHLPEIRQTLNLLQPQMGNNLIFVPHLTPLIRGMHATIYIQIKDGHNPHQLIADYYRTSPFVDVMPTGSMPETRTVRGANLCRISVQPAPQNNTWIILSVIDNLVKGAAGQAVQNMNIMFGLDETSGLKHIPLLP